MKIKDVPLKPGTPVWLYLIPQFGEFPKGLFNYLKVTFVSLDQEKRMATVRRADGRLFEVRPEALDAGHLYQFEPRGPWLPESDPDVLAVMEAKLYAYREQDVPQAMARDRSQTIGMVEWAIMRNGGSFFDDNADKYRFGEPPGWMVR